MDPACEERTIKAALSIQEQLLQLQDVDLAVARILRQKATLPQTARVKELTQALAAARDDAVAKRMAAQDLRRQVRKVEGEVEMLRNRQQKDQALLDGGTITSAKQLSDLQHEIESLKRRQREVEDAELEAMELQEAADQAQSDAEAHRDSLAAQLAQAEQERESAITALREEFQRTKAEQHRVADGIPTDLLAMYRKIRDERDGIGAVVMTGNACGGCQIQLGPTELAVVLDAPADEILRCDECRRILVRRD